MSAIAVCVRCGGTPWFAFDAKGRQVMHEDICRPSRPMNRAELREKYRLPVERVRREERGFRR